MADNAKSATYRYTADEQRELDALKRKYAPDAPSDALEAARALDRQATRRAVRQAVLFGVIATLVFGTGLSLVLSFELMAPGILMGCLGIAAMAAMPALYDVLLRRQRRQAAPRIRALLGDGGIGNRE